MMAWDLSGNHATELLRLALSQRLSRAQMAQLMDTDPTARSAGPESLLRRARRSAGREQVCIAAQRIPPRQHRRRRLEQLGGRRLAHGVRQAAAGQRSAPRAERAGAVVLRPPVGARPRRDRRHAARPARGRAGPQPAHRLGLHQHRARHPGPVPRAHRPGRRRAATARRRARRRFERAHEIIQVQGRARRADDGARDPARAGDLRRARPAGRAMLSRELAAARTCWPSGGPRSRPTTSTMRAGFATQPRVELAGVHSTRCACSTRRSRTWSTPTSTATSASSRPDGCRCAARTTPPRTRAGAGLGRALRLGRLHPVRRAAARFRPAAGVPS